MITEKIELKRDRILDKVHEDSAYLGAKSMSDPIAWENTPLLDGEESVVEPWLDEAASKLMLACWKYMVSSDKESGNGSVEIVLRMPNNWKTATDQSSPQNLNELAFKFACEWVLAQWLAYRNVDDAKNRLEMANSALDTLIQAMDARVPMSRSLMGTNPMDDSAILNKLKDNVETVLENDNCREQVVIVD